MQASDADLEILDLRHFAAPVLRPLLDAEAAIWAERLHWDYRSSVRLLMQYIDNRMLPGYALIETGRVIGYVFCVYEDTKAVIGDVFALPGSQENDPGLASTAYNREETLLRHLFELLLNSPHVERIESQLLLHPSGLFAPVFRDAGFQVYRRLFLVQPLDGHWSQHQVELPPHLEFRVWRDTDLAPAARLIYEAYRNHPDSSINDQYRSVHGSLRFLNNIVRYAGCGAFAAQASYVVVDRVTRALAALVLGSRVSEQSGHLTQVCVHPAFRRRGLARMMLAQAASSFLRMGAAEISLTVTEANTGAIRLYYDEGYRHAHSFDAAVWRHTPTA